MASNPGAGSDTATSVHDVGEHAGGSEFSTMGIKKMLKMGTKVVGKKKKKKNASKIKSKKNSF